jgi:hypothetical protein
MSAILIGVMVVSVLACGVLLWAYVSAVSDFGSEG